MKLSKFLKYIKELKIETIENPFYVIGNEASDLDSIASSISYAYFLKMKDSKNEYIPIMNIPREDFQLRTETVWFFKKLELDSSDLLFFPEIKLPKHFSLILTDHNRLAPHQEQYSNNVFEIIDHHEDEKKYDLKKDKRKVEPVGSVCTLITEKLLESSIELDSIVYELLLGTILIDTQNLDPKNPKTKEKDIEMVKKLNEKCKFKDVEQKNLFEKLIFERFSVDSLTTYDLLRSDYKQFIINKITFGVSSVKLNLYQWVQKDQQLKENLENFREKMNLDVLYAMNSSLDHGKIEKFILIYSKNSFLMKEMIDFLLQTNLNLKSLNLIEDSMIFTFRQENTGASRKQLVPFLADFCNKK